MCNRGTLRGASCSTHRGKDPALTVTWPSASDMVLQHSHVPARGLSLTHWPCSVSCLRRVGLLLRYPREQITALTEGLDVVYVVGWLAAETAVAFGVEVG